MVISELPIPQMGKVLLHFSKWTACLITSALIAFIIFHCFEWIRLNILIFAEKNHETCEDSGPRYAPRLAVFNGRSWAQSICTSRQYCITQILARVAGYVNEIGVLNISRNVIGLGLPELSLNNSSVF